MKPENPYSLEQRSCICLWSGESRRLMVRWKCRVSLKDRNEVWICTVSWVTTYTIQSGANMVRHISYMSDWSGLDFLLELWMIECRPVEIWRWLGWSVYRGIGAGKVQSVWKMTWNCLGCRLNGHYSGIYCIEGLHIWGKPLTLANNTNGL